MLSSAEDLLQVITIAVNKVRSEAPAWGLTPLGVNRINMVAQELAKDAQKSCRAAMLVKLDNIQSIHEAFQAQLKAATTEKQVQEAKDCGWLADWYIETTVVDLSTFHRSFPQTATQAAS